MKFEVGQEVWVIEESVTKSKIKCKCCDGTGKLIARCYKEPDYIECVCPDCKGKEAFGTKTKFLQVKATIESRIEFFDYRTEEKYEAYIINKRDNIFTDNVEECKRYFSTLEFMFEGGYDNISFDEGRVISIDNLFETKEEVIKECKKLKERKGK